MFNILPGRPIAAKDKYGNRLYFTPSGKLTLKINTDGTMVFSLTTKTKEYNKEGQLERTSEKIKGTNLVVVKNEKGEVLGYQELGLGGKVIREYDKDMNLVKSYLYDKYGKNTVYVLSEESQIKTIYDDKGRAIVDVNFEGTEVAWYVYDENNKLKFKIDIQGNKTEFDEKGRILYTKDQFGNVLINYYYKKDENGNDVLEKTVDYLGNITYYKNDKPFVKKDREGNVLFEYHYDGSKLVYTFDKTQNTVTWFDIDGRPLYTSFNEEKIKEYLYHNGILVGIWDYTNNTLSAVIHGQEVGRFFYKEKPTAEFVQNLISQEVIRKEYTANQPLLYSLYLKKTLSSENQPKSNIVVKSKNKEVIGYFNKDEDLIPIYVVYFNKNGIIEKKEDLLTQKVQEFDLTGKITRAYNKITVLENNKLVEKIYEAKVKYNEDGSYSISWCGIIDKDGNPDTFYDREIIEDAQVQNFSFDGRILSIIYKNFVDGKYKTAIEEFVYDNAGSLIKKRLINEERRVLFETFYQNNLEQYTLKYVYDNNSKFLGSFVISKNFYKNMKLISKEIYELVDLTKQTTKISSTIYYDEHQRMSIVCDALNRVVQRYFYNDKNDTVYIPIKIEKEDGSKIFLNIKVVGGGVLYSEEYTYTENNKLEHIIRNYFYNGNIEYKAISYLKE